MPESCAAYNCTNRRKKRDDGVTISFHKFPLQKPELLQRWLNAMRRADWSPSKSSVLCEKHFKQKDYVIGEIQTTSAVNLSKKYLRADAVPSVFHFPPHLQKEHKRKSPVKRKLSSCSETKVTSKPVPNKKQKLCTKPIQDHSYCVSPSKVIPKIKKSLSNNQKKVRALTRKNLRKEKTIKGLVKKLENMKHLSNEQSQSLTSNFGHMAKELFTNEHKNAKKSKSSRYSDLIKQFAVTLHFYSPKAYKYVRNILHLPCQASIRSWAAAINCEPGFLTDVIQHLQTTLDEDDKDCILLVDEMSIKKEVVWDKKNKKFAGNTDYGHIQGEEKDSIATNALVVMAVGLKNPWFHPVAYFLVDRLNSQMQAQIIKESINHLTDAGLEVHGVTFDGCAKNLATARYLGCKINQFDGSFKHPSRPNKTLYVILDICHMLKLARNSLGDMKLFFTESGNKICWQFITDLYNVQKTDVLHLGNKLTSTHIKWHNKKMKVSVAAQTLSSSVAAGIMYLQSLKLKQFENSRDTAEFILTINNLFDMLNSKSKYGKNYRSPLKQENLDETQHFLNDTIDYLTKLQDNNGIKLVNGPRKTFIVGFAVSSKSILAIARNLLTRNYNQFKYVLTYRFSQDQLEMFFSKIRSRFGWNNNPNALQFKWALRALLQKNQVSPSTTANCSVIEEGKLAEEVNSIDSKVASYLNSSAIWQDDVMEYIGGYIAKKISKCLKCAECAAALAMEDVDVFPQTDHTYCGSSSKADLISFKSYGQLKRPTPSLVKVVKVADRHIRLMVGDWSNFSEKALKTLQRNVLQETKPTVFNSLQQHSLETHVVDQSLRDDHITVLIKKITDLYSKIFLHRFAKVYSERIVRQEKPSQRNKLTKLILFGHD